MGGSIKVSSKEGYGSTFSIILPMQPGSSQPTYHISENRIHKATSLEFSDLIL
jgi:hypothetical protein